MNKSGKFWGILTGIGFIIFGTLRFSVILIEYSEQMSTNSYRLAIASALGLIGVGIWSVFYYALKSDNK